VRLLFAFSLLFATLGACRSEPSDPPAGSADDSSTADSPTTDSSAEPECGDGTCDVTEYCETCPEDCGECGDEDCGHQPKGSDGPATLPSEETDVTLLDSSGWRSFSVAATGADFSDIQDAYEAAVLAGEPVRITVEAGHEAGDLMLADRQGSTDWIYIQPEAVGPLPAGERVSYLDAEHMYRLRGELAGGSWTEPVGAEPGSGYTRIIGADISIPEADISLQRSHVVRIRADENGEGSDPTEAEELPTHVILDRVYVHVPTDGTVFAAYLVGLYGHHLALIDSYVVGGGRGWEACKAVFSGYGEGPLLIQNNYLASDGINLFFGGDDSAHLGWIPSDITVRGNHIHKPAEWAEAEGLSTKNSFEIKSAQRVLVERNILENNWVDAQSGWMVLLRAESKDGVCEDITFRFNHLTNSPSGWNIIGRDEAVATRSTRRLSLHDNLHTRFAGNTDFTSPGHQMRLEGKPDYPLIDVWITHNTFDDLGGQGAMMSLSAQGVGEGIVVRDNIMPRGAYGLKADGLVDGTASLDGSFGEGAWSFETNVLADVNEDIYPEGGNEYPTLEVLQTQFVDAAADDLTLVENSAYRSGGLHPPTDGDMRGADIECLDVLLEGVDRGVYGSE
jgi:hypothetical protein